ncbi:hypothetical protein [Candidatus Enterovibrio altilux]|nr:hypothetical protein [Candidatus Enterovibrio luxaltus]
MKCYLTCSNRSCAESMNYQEVVLTAPTTVALIPSKKGVTF